MIHDPCPIRLQCLKGLISIAKLWGDLDPVIGLLDIGHGEGVKSRRDAQAQPLHPLGFLQHADDGRVQVGLEYTLHPREYGTLQEGGVTPMGTPLQVTGGVTSAWRHTYLDVPVSHLYDLHPALVVEDLVLHQSQGHLVVAAYHGLPVSRLQKGIPPGLQQVHCLLQMAHQLPTP